MTRNQWLITLFWVIIGTLLIYQAYEYNDQLAKKAAAHPEPHVYSGMYNPSAAPGALPSVADVRQVSYVVTPEAGGQTFTSQVTLKNEGTVKATDIRILVRPFRGAIFGDMDLEPGKAHVLTEDDPVSQIGQWVSLHDLVPGESASATLTFVGQAQTEPGQNPHPQIIFSSEKSHP